MFVKSFFFGDHEDPWVCCQSKQSKRWWKEEEASKESTQACCIFYAFWFGFSCFCFFSFFLFYWDLGFSFCWGLLLFEKNPHSLFLFEKIDGCTTSLG